MRFQGFASKYAHFALAFGLAVFGSQPQAFATSDCTSAGYLFEGEIISRDRVQGEIKVSQEWEVLPESWSIHSPIYSNVILRTKDSKAQASVKSTQIYVQVAKQIAGPFSLDTPFAAATGQSRARVKELKFRKIVDSARQRKSGKVEFSVRSGDEIICTHIMTVKGGD